MDSLMHEKWQELYSINGSSPRHFLPRHSLLSCRATGYPVASRICERLHARHTGRRACSVAGLERPTAGKVSSRAPEVRPLVREAPARLVDEPSSARDGL